MSKVYGSWKILQDVSCQSYLVNSINFLSQVEELDPFETVLTMRRQRMKMVQKPMQYNYMFRCLADYVAETTSDYV